MHRPNTDLSHHRGGVGLALDISLPVPCNLGCLCTEHSLSKAGDELTAKDSPCKYGVEPVAVGLLSVGPAAQTPLWIDAICIDQSSPDEVSAQVELMADIYRLAAGVVAWLGAEEDDVPALEWLINVAIPSLKRKRAELCGEEHFDYSQATILGLSAVAKRWTAFAETRHPCDPLT